MSNLSTFLLNFYTIFQGCPAASENETRYQRELNAMPQGLYVFHENGTLVEITMQETPDPDSFKSRDFRLPNTFHLYTRWNQEISQLLWTDDIMSLLESDFDSWIPTRIITHGWSNSGTSASCTLIRDAYLAVGDYNVIVFDWSSTSFMPYIWASNRVLSIGLEVSRMVDFLIDYGLSDPDDILLVGHSLGAHIVGIAGYYSKYKMSQIVGLDPALPMFQFAGAGSAITSMDARHVQIIHTNAGFLGYLSAAGHTDFYPNGGTKQPGCGALFTCACSHERAYHLFTESIASSTPFYGLQCDSYIEYLSGECAHGNSLRIGGASLDRKLTGKYYLTTSDRPPYFITRTNLH